MGYCSNVHTFSQPQVGVRTKQRAERPTVEIPKPNARFMQQEAAVPRTSPASGFFSSIAKLPQRVSKWIQEEVNVAHVAILKFGYERAAMDSRVALDLALSGDHGCFSKRQLLNLANCRARVNANLKALKSLNSAAATRLCNAYNEALANDCRNRIKELDELKIKMAALTKKQYAARKSAGYGHAYDLCKQLTKAASAIRQPAIR